MSTIWISVLGLMGLLAFAVLMLPAAKRLAFPYTVLLAAAGTILGILQIFVGDHPLLGPIGDFLRALEGFDITAESVFFIFLPTLIFEAGLSINVRRLMDDLGPILMLAIVGLLLSTFMVGWAIHWATAMSLLVCLLIGAICSATDPVAVIALFKEVGAPKRLSILVEGESLFNDATAIVLFTILLSIILGNESTSVLEAMMAFIKVFFGGVIWGLLSGRFLCWLVQLFPRLILVNITLSICAAYLTFITAEHYFHISGVMSVLTAALVTSAIGRTIMAPHHWFELEQIWEQIGFWANSIIFILVGMAVPKLLNSISVIEAYGLMAVIMSAMVARALITYGMLPCLSFFGIGKPVSTAYKTVMFWGGLRGAVSLALALAVIENPAISSEHQHFVAVLVTGFVLFTLFVNATTIRFVMMLFGLGQLSSIEKIMRDKAVSGSLTKIADKLKDFVDTDSAHRHLADALSETYRTMGASLKTGEYDPNIDQNDWMKLGLSILAAQEKRHYYSQFSGGLLHSHIFRLLIAQVDELMDALKHEGIEGYIHQTGDKLSFDWRYKLAAFIQRHLHVNKFLSLRLAEHLYTLVAKRSALKSIRQDQFDKIRPFLDEETTDKLQRCFDDRCQKTEQAIAALSGQYPEYAAGLFQRQLTQSGLWLEEREYQSLAKDGLITQDVFKDLNQQTLKKMTALGQLPKLDLHLEPEALVQKVPLFRHCNEQQIAKITKLLQPVLSFPGDTIIQKGTTGNTMYFIASGAVSIKLPSQTLTLGSGDFFGEIAILKKMPRIADVISLGYCKLLVLGHGEFQNFLAENPELKAAIEQAGEERLQASTDPSPTGIST